MANHWNNMVTIAWASILSSITRYTFTVGNKKATFPRRIHWTRLTGRPIKASIHVGITTYTKIVNSMSTYWWWLTRHCQWHWITCSLKYKTAIVVFCSSEMCCSTDGVRRIAGWQVGQVSPAKSTKVMRKKQIKQ